MKSTRRSQKPRAAHLQNRHRKLSDSASWWWTDWRIERLAESFVEDRVSMAETLEKTKRLLYSLERERTNEPPPFEQWLPAKERSPEFRQCLKEFEAWLRQKRRESRRRPKDA
jgi:hypothetical protein